MYVEISQTTELLLLLFIFNFNKLFSLSLSGNKNIMLEANMNSEVTNYSVIGRIGEGAHGLVFKARHLPTGRVVALKKILIKNLDDGIPVNVFREIKGLQLLRCKYVSFLIIILSSNLILIS